jgi:L-amino acid N-acyltransferase YncA
LLQNLPKSPQIPSQQQHPLNEVQETSTKLTKQATGTTVGIGDDTPASSSPRHDVKKHTTTKNAEFQVTTGPVASKGHGWPKKRDMRASIKGGDNDGGVSLKSNSNHDPTYHIRKITDWEGNWLPAPVEWEGRGGFSGRNFYNRIEAWMNKSEKVSKENMDISDPAFVAETNGEVAPRFWIPSTLDAESPQSFWRTYQRRAPAPLSDCDPAEQPWWETYTSATSALLPPINVPEAKLDTVEFTYALAIEDFGSNGAIKKREEAKNAKKLSAAEKKQLKLQRKRNYPEITETFIPIDRSLKPKANVYLRSAYPGDIVQMTDLYNHYVTNTIHCPEFNPRTTQNLVNRLADILTNGLPWIVAVDRSKYTGLYSSWVTHIPEKIVGLAYADDFCHPGSMYRYTVELDIFVHPDYCNKGIGSCLMDKMLNLMDIEYQARAGYEWTAKADVSGSVGSRVVKTVICQVPYDAGDGTDILWTTKFLRRFGFKKAGDIQCMGFKCDKT